MNSMNHYINGKWISGNGHSFHSLNPADNSVIYETKQATLAEIETAFYASQEAFRNWREFDITRRIEYLEKFAKIVAHNKEKLTEAISKESGKPLWESITEVESVISKVEISIDAYHNRCSTKEIRASSVTQRVLYKPHGVVLVIGPYNFPAHLSNSHIIPALLAGNTVIWKPSELTPYVAHLIMQFWDEAGLPPGVIQCLQGGSPVAQALINYDINALYFTGSYATGVRINKMLASRPEVIVALEMGGNNPLIIGNIGDLDAGVYNSIISAFITTGQRCTCARRIIVPDNANGDEFLTKFIKTAQSLNINSYNSSPEPFMGPMIRSSHAIAVLKQQEQLIDQGAKVLTLAQHMKENSGFISPGILDMSGNTIICDQEIFGPLVQVYRYKNFADAIKIANNTIYGLISGLFSDDENEFQEFSKIIKTGIIHWNRPTTGASSRLPFGGIGHSGNFRPSGYYAADYCSYPVAYNYQEKVVLPKELVPGFMSSRT